MTALAGFWSHAMERDPCGACRQILRAQSIYGHQDAFWAGKRIGLGRRLYRLLPEDAFDRGIVLGADGRFALAADLRIDNRDELAAFTGLHGGARKDLSDAALLMRGWERFGEAVLEHLVGDFAFALWDQTERKLVLARDFMGRRPLHYHRARGWFAFSSMPKGLHALPEVPSAPDLEATLDFVGLVQGCGTRSFYAGISRVEPGHIVSVTAEVLKSRCFWNPDLSPLDMRGSNAYEEALREKFDAAVKARLRGVGDTVGAHLSAGLDSSAVTTTAARMLGPQSGRVVAFTAIPRAGTRLATSIETIADEGPQAAATAASYANIDHVQVTTDGRSLLRHIDRNHFYYDRPRLNLCNQLWMDAIKDEMKAQRLTVLLTGELGNLSISCSGMELLPQLLASGRLWRLAREAVLLRRKGSRFGTVAAATLQPFLPTRLRDAIAVLLGHRRVDAAALNRVSALRSGTLARMRSMFQPAGNSAHIRLAALRRWDGGNYTKGSLAGWGVDLRDPTADRRVVEFCLRVPDAEYLRDGVSRSLARRAFSDRLLPEVVQGLHRGLQLSEWADIIVESREELEREVSRFSGLPGASEALDLVRISDLIEDWPDNLGHDVTHLDYRHVLLRAVSAGHFIRKASGSNA